MYDASRPECTPPLDADAPLWRILDLAKFEWLITKRALYFRRADRFEDPLEGTLPLANREVPRFWGFPLDLEAAGSAEFVDAKDRIWDQYRRSMYVNCWFAGLEPTVQMWDEYGKHGAAVAIRSSFARLALALAATPRRIAISHVRYVDRSQVPINERRLSDALLSKELRYDFEREVRAFFTIRSRSLHSFWRESGSDGIAVPVSISQLVSGIAFSPGSDESIEEHVRLLLPWSGVSLNE